MSTYQYCCTWVELEGKLENALNKTLGEADTSKVFLKTVHNPKITGIAGDVIEQSVIGFAANSDKNPDLIIDGVETELKTTGLRTSKMEEGLEAKEPMSITGVSLNSIVHEEFETSAFWHKAQRMLIVYYLYDSQETVPAAEYAEFPIIGYQLHEFDDSEVKSLKADWTLVRNFIRNIHENHEDEEGRKAEYPKLSSALRKDLLLIDTAPKYPHPPRFRLKRSTVTTIARKNFGETLQQLPKQYSTMSELDAELHKVAEKYCGHTMGELAKHYGINTVSKGTIERLVVSMFGGTAKRMLDIEIFAEAGLKAKSITLRKDGKRTEDMKLFTINFDEFSSAESLFEESAIYNYFAEGSIVCVVLEEPSVDAPLSENVFKGFKRVAFDDDFIESCVRPTYEEIKRLIVYRELVASPVIEKKTGKPKINKTGVAAEKLNFPKSSDYTVFVRGTSSDSTNKPECVNGIKMYRQQYWIRGSYMAERLANTNWI